MNRWAVYNWIKETYMFAGLLPRKTDVIERFQWATVVEIEAGIEEFEKTVGRKVPGSWRERNDRIESRNVV